MTGALRQHSTAFARKVRERGFLPTLRIALSTLWCAGLDALDERRYRTNTASNIPVESLEIHSENKVHASPFTSPSQFRVMRKAFEAVRELRGGGFSASTLVDFGCAKGRVLLVASEFGFKRVVGVEFSRELCRDAEANIEAWIKRTKQPFDFQVVNADAARFEIPPEADVFYFFAFDGHVLDQVVQNLVRSRQRFPRAIWAIYVKATYGEVFGARGFRVARELSWCGFPTRIYTL